MYRVYVKNMNGEYPIYEPLDDTLRIFEPVLTQEMGGAGSFTFQIYISIHKALAGLDFMAPSSG